MPLCTIGGFSEGCIDDTGTILIITIITIITICINILVYVSTIFDLISFSFPSLLSALRLLTLFRSSSIVIIIVLCCLLLVRLQQLRRFDLPLLCIPVPMRFDALLNAEK